MCGPHFQIDRCGESGRVAIGSSVVRVCASLSAMAKLGNTG